ncbi:helix-turn-helix domain-containing protein [Mycobacterium adipatum]
MRSIEDFNTVRALIAAGLNDCAIARQTGIPRRTVCGWRNNPSSITPRDSCSGHDYSLLPSDAYSYLLGMYLGDGYISRCRSVWRLRGACLIDCVSGWA